MDLVMFVQRICIIFFPILFRLSISISAKHYPARDLKFIDIFTNITAYDSDTLQLRIKWNDTLREDWHYNVVVAPINVTTECSKLPCGAYGILKPKDGEIVLPRDPVSYLEHVECSILPGCTYTVKVETSNGSASKTKQITIPDCVAGVCSCKHASNLPKINATLEFLSNDTIKVRWRISLQGLPTRQSDNKSYADIFHALKLDRIFIGISQQVNPSLTWGGKRKLLQESFHRIVLNATSQSSGLITGDLICKAQNQISSNSIIHLRTHIVDRMRCAGPEAHFKLQMSSDDSKVKKTDSDSNVRLGLINVSVLFLFSIVATIITYAMWRRKRTKEQIVVQENLFLPLPISIGAMEDNITYVDKDVAEAQSKGLADIFEVSHSAICVGPEIGGGAFGRVFKATARNLRQMQGTSIVAVKQLKRNPTADEVEEFLMEIEMLKGVGTHTNIVSFLGCCTIRPPYMVIMEYVGRGDLLDYLRTARRAISSQRTHSDSLFNGEMLNSRTPLTRQNGRKGVVIASPNEVKYIELKCSANSEQSAESSFVSQNNCANLKPSVTETMYTMLSDVPGNSDDNNESTYNFQYILDNKELHNFALQIANGMRFLEEQEITHRDLAARNVLIDDRKTLKISDFGLSRYGIYTNTRTRKLPLRWLSIEAIRDNLYSNKSDVWAFGVVLWEIGTLGASPYPTISNSEIIPFLMAGKRLEKPKICTDQLYALMMDCWSEHPEDRPNFNDIYQKLGPKTAYIDLNSLSDDYVFPPITEKETLK